MLYYDFFPILNVWNDGLGLTLQCSVMKNAEKRKEKEKLQMILIVCVCSTETSFLDYQ